MNQKNIVIILSVVVVVLLGVILFGAFGYLRFAPKQATPPVLEISAEPALTEEIFLSLLGAKESVLSLLRRTGCRPEGIPEGIEEGWAGYDSCSIDIFKEEYHWVVMVTYDGLYDDSVRAIQLKTIVTRDKDKNNQWVIRGDSTPSWRCDVGRGHQYFSNEKLCI